MNASKTFATGAAIVAASFAGAGVVLALGGRSASSSPFGSAAAPSAAADGATRVSDTAPTAKRIYESAKDAVAYISAQTMQGTSTGTGFAVSADGLIVTNAHVVDGASQVEVKLGTGGEAQAAQLVGTDASKDLAVLRIAAPSGGIPVLKLADSSQVGVGDAAYAIGNPYGLDHTFTTGIVSAIGREIQAPDGSPISGAIQTDAAINPGNSGGPLLNADGDVIGVNSQIVSGAQTGSGGNVGIGFAVPSNTVAGVLRRAASGDLDDAATQQQGESYGEQQQQAQPYEQQQQAQPYEQQQAQPYEQQQVGPSLEQQLLHALQG